MQEVRTPRFHRPKTAVPLSEAAISEVCTRWKIDELFLFGSVLSNSFHADSDIDIMVKFSSDAQVGLFEFVEIKQELEGIFNRKVDIMTKQSIERSRNLVRRKEILESAKLVYAS